MLRRKRLADLPEHWDFGELTPGTKDAKKLPLLGELAMPQGID